MQARRAPQSTSKSSIRAELSDSVKFLRAAVAETLWPSRCVVCDLPGDALCPNCALNLPFIDQLRACPVCGAPWGRTICCECNQQTLRWKGLERFPLDGCASAVALAPETKKIVTAFKDQGERQLARIIAHYLAEVLPPAWRKRAALVPIPARSTAVRQRGFDHVALITAELAHFTGLPILPLLTAKPRKDQRNLDAQQRLANMSGSFALAEAKHAALQARLRFFPHVILVDDVFTTGATLFTAAETLKPLGPEKTYALTFIRA